MPGLDGAAPVLDGVLHDGQTQSGAAHLTGAHLVHPVEAVEDVGQILIRYADAVVADGDDHPLPVHMRLRVDKAVLRRGVFDGVFHEVVEDLMYIVVGSQRHGVLVRRAGDGHALLLRHHVQHPLHPLHHRRHRHRIGLLHHAAVQPRQPQQVLRDAAEPLRLPADVGNELLGSLLVHVVGL